MLTNDEYNDLLEDAHKALLNQYSNLSLYQKQSPVTCIKVNMTFNNINTTLYFDCFQNIETMILKLDYSSQIYLGIIHLGKYIQDLNKTGKLCHQLLKGGNLKPFYIALATKIIKNKTLNTQATYNDIEFIEATREYMKHNKNNNLIPQLFLHDVRRVNMSKERFRSLIDDNKIPYKEVQKIKDAGYTVVRTDDPSKRRTITFLLNKIYTN